MKINTKSGFAPLLIVAIVAILGIGTGAAVYVNKQNKAQESSKQATDKAVVTEKSETKITEKEQVKTATKSGITAKADVKAEIKTETKIVTQPAVVVAKVETKAVTDVSLIKTIQQGMDYGKDVVCTLDLSKPELIHTIKYFFSPRFPGIFSEETTYTSFPDTDTDTLTIQDTNKEYQYTKHTKGAAATLPPAETSRVKVSINSWAYCPRDFDFSKVQMYENQRCVEQSIPDSYFVPDQNIFANETPANTVVCPREGVSSGKGS